METHASPRVSALRGIYAILNDGPNLGALADAVLAGGVRIVQYRAKAGIAADRLRALRERTRAASALLIVNDDVEAAAAFDCDGVHLGPDDRGFVDVSAVRARLGDRLVGLSCGTPAEAREARRQGADYMGVGAVFATSSKSDAGEPIGIAGLRAVADAAHLPVAAIGGITEARLADVRAAGVAMAAVISAISGAPDPRAAARRLVERWDGNGAL